MPTSVIESWPAAQHWSRQVLAWGGVPRCDPAAAPWWRMGHASSTFPPEQQQHACVAVAGARIPAGGSTSATAEAVVTAT
jgi:hypothetical protein